MGLVNRLLSQFIEVIEWMDPTTDTIVYRFPVDRQEIKMGAQLIVREGQAGVFVNEGQLADVFPPGHYTLTTRNMPILTMLKSWKYEFNSPFKAEVYFVSTRQFTDLKWGTSNPIMMRDSEFGMVRLRAFGAYSMRVADPGIFMKEIVGTKGSFDTDSITGQLRDFVVNRFTDALGALKIPALDLASNYISISQSLQARLSPDFQQYGLGLTSFLIQNISLPPEVEAAMDKRTSMGIVGDLNKYTQYQTAEAIQAAAANPGGGGGMTSGLTLGAGLALGQQVAQSLQNNQAAGQQAAAAEASRQTLVNAPKTARERLADLKSLLDDDLINEDDFKQRKAAILSEM